MMILPPNAFMVLQDDPIPEEETESLIYLLKDPAKKDEKPNTGRIIFTAPELEQYQLEKVVFRINFADQIMIDGKEFLYFRDFNSSIYYVITEDEIAENDKK